jgi:hypothetical protein
LFVLGAEFIKSIFVPLLYDNYYQGNYIMAMLLTMLVGTKHCIFPFVGYAFFGGVISLLLYRDRNNSRILKIIGYSLSLFFGIIAAIDAILNGIPQLIALYHPFFLYILNLSLQISLGTFCLTIFDTVPISERKFKTRFKLLVPFRRLSTVSLTIFMTEQTIAGLYTKLFIIIFPNSMQNILFLFFIYIPIYMVLWFEFIALWEKNYFKYSIEWFLAKLFRSSPKKDILGIEENIYKNSGFLNREEYKAIKNGKKYEVETDAD